MKDKTKEQLIDYLLEHITAERQKRIEQVLVNRTRQVTVVLENVYQPHNASAVIRSCDCFGIQELHIIEKEYHYRVNKDVAVGASKWIDIFRYNGMYLDNSQYCIEHLKKEGYRIIATVPDSNHLLEDLAVDKKLALIFGTEEAGLSDLALKLADERVRIPMYGFTKSFNVSVSAALCLSQIVAKLHKSDVDWRLSEEEQRNLRLEWIKKTLKQRADHLIEKFFESNF